MRHLFHWLLGFFVGDGRSWGSIRMLFGLTTASLITWIAFAIEYAFFDKNTPTYLEIMFGNLNILPQSTLRWLSIYFSWNVMRFYIFPIGCLVILILLAARYIQDIYAIKSYQVCVDYVTMTLFGSAYPLLRIKKGKKILKEGEENTVDIIGGPGYIYIDPSSAVLIEGMTTPARVETQGQFLLTRYEKLGEIVDLTDQHGTVDRRTAISKDGITVTVQNIQFRYRIHGAYRRAGITGRNPNNPYPFSVRSIRRIAYARQANRDSLSNWTGSVSGKIDGEILRFIRQNPLDEVITGRPGEPTVRDQIINQLRSPGFRRGLSEIGAELLWFDIGYISFEEPLVEQEWINVWAAPWRGQAEVNKAEGDIQRTVQMDMARAQAQADALKALIDSFQEEQLDSDMNPDSMAKLFLFKVSHVLEGMTRSYQQNPEGE